MKRIDVFIEGRGFGIRYYHWLIEDCEDCFWVIDSTGCVSSHDKPKYSFVLVRKGTK